MSEWVWVSEAPVERLRPFLPKSRAQVTGPSHGARARVDDWWVVSRTIRVGRGGLMWKDAASAWGPARTLYNRWKRWEPHGGVLARRLADLAAEGPQTEAIRTDATHPRTGRRRACEARGPAARRGRLIAHTTGGLTSKPHVVADGRGWPGRMPLPAGQRSDCLSAAALLSSLPQARTLIADRGSDADRVRRALMDRAIAAGLPSRTRRKAPSPHDPAPHRQRHRIEAAFGRLKDRRRVAAPSSSRQPVR